MRVTSAEFLVSAGQVAQFPRGQQPEIAFAGRSNVGKSSLINRLVNRRRLAHTSGTPGTSRRRMTGTCKSSSGRWRCPRWSS